MTFLEYQKLAMRTQAIKDNKIDMLIHATCGLSSELGEIVQVYNDLLLNNNAINLYSRLESELGDFCWFQAELCEALDISLHYQDLNKIDQLIFCGENNYSLEKIGFYINKLMMLNGIISGNVQKMYQRRNSYVDKEKITEILYVMNVIINTIAGQLLNTNIEDIWNKNIEKLMKRFPKEFDKELDVHRQEGDL